MLTPTRLIAPKCAKCGGLGAYYTTDDYGHPDYGKAVRCLECADLFKTSNLPQSAHALTIADLANRVDDPTGEVTAMRFLAKQMLKHRSGFLSFVGLCGNGKTLLIQAMVAEFCRLKIDAIYYTCPDLATKLTVFSPEGNELRPESLIARLKKVTVLALDEPDKIAWSPWRQQMIGEVVDYRSQNADHLVTLIAANSDPDQWVTREGVSVAPIKSRMIDGRYNRLWPIEYAHKLPECLQQYVTTNGQHYAPGYFTTTLPDARTITGVETCSK